MSGIICSKCNKPVEELDKFCPHCGASLKETVVASNTKTDGEPKTFTSAGNYSGKMVKGKTSKSWKILKIIILIVGIIAVIAFAIWYKTDPNAKETLGNILFALVVMAIFGFFIWRKNRKMSKRSLASRRDEDNLNKLHDQDIDNDDNDDDDFDDD